VLVKHVSSAASRRMGRGVLTRRSWAAGHAGGYYHSYCCPYGYLGQAHEHGGDGAVNGKCGGGAISPQGRDGATICPPRAHDILRAAFGVGIDIIIFEEPGFARVCSDLT